MSGLPSRFSIDQVEASLLLLLTGPVSAAYGTRINVDSLGDKDFDAEGTLVLSPPSIRLRFLGARYVNMRDNQRLTYEGGYQFEVLCFESSLRSKADARKQTLALVAVVSDQLAGARLALSDGTSSQPITLESVQLVVTDEGPIDQLFSIGILVNGAAQFSGANARFGQ